MASKIFNIQYSVFKTFGIGLAFTLLLFYSPSLAGAACYPINPQTGACDSPLATCSNDTTCCDNFSDCTERKACSSDQPWERIPSCDVCGDVLFCSGNNYRTCTTDSTFPDPQLGVNRATYVANSPGSVTFNGVNYPVPSGGLYYCDSNLSGCGNEMCRGAAGGPDTGNRIYFPHVKNTSAITYILQSLFRPISLAIDAFKNQVIYSKVELHQGVNDDTRVINRTDNNSSLPVGEAPRQPFEFTAPPPGVPNVEGTCLISDVRTNPGDDLLGEQISADLQYTQEFRYNLDAGLVAGTCQGTGAVVTGKSQCCSGDAACTAGKFPVCTCTAKKVFLPTKGKVLVYTKSPYVEYLYENLVGGPMAIFKRFVSKDTAANIEDISTKTSIGVFASHAERGPSEVLAGDTTKAPEIYFPRVGSIYEYFLKDLQKLLRPKSTAISATGVSPPSSSECNPMDYTIEFRNTAISPKPVETLISQLRTDNPGGFGQSTMDKAADNIRKNYNAIIVESQKAGYNPAFVMATWIEETAASALSGLDFGCGGAGSNDFDGQLSCFLGLFDDWSKGGRYDNLVGSCRTGGDNPNFEDFMLYFAEGICQTIERQSRQFCGIHANFPTRFRNFYDVVVK